MVPILGYVASHDHKPYKDLFGGLLHYNDNMLRKVTFRRYFLGSLPVGIVLSSVRV
jgi:hypothetical protein